MNRLRCLFCVLNLLFYLLADGQQYVDIARITASLTPKNAFDSSLVSTRVRENVADITLPFKLNERVAVLTGFLYENLHAKVSEANNSYTDVHAMMLKAGLNFSLSEKWRSTILLMPKVSSDFRRKFNQNDFQFGGSLLLRYKKSEAFNWQFGGYYNGELFGAFFVPLLGFYYKSPNTKWEANVLLPASVDMNYAFNEKWRIGGSFVSFVKTFHLSEQIAGANSTYWNKSTNELFGYIQAEPVHGLLLQMRAGYSIARRFSVYDMDDKIDWALMAFKFGDNRNRLNQWFADGSIFQLRLIYRYYLN